MRLHIFILCWKLLCQCLNWFCWSEVRPWVYKAINTFWHFVSIIGASSIFDQRCDVHIYWTQVVIIYVHSTEGWPRKCKLFEVKEKSIKCSVIDMIAKCWTKLENKGKFNLLPLCNNHKLYLGERFSGRFCIVFWLCTLCFP